MTDQAINLSGDKRIIETVVDSTYKTKSGALNKVFLFAKYRIQNPKYKVFVLTSLKS